MSAPFSLRPRSRCGLVVGLFASAWLIAAGGPPTSDAETYVWVDENGITHLSDTPAGGGEVSEVHDGHTIDELRAVWGREILGPPLETPRGSSGSEDDRIQRLLAGAVEDLRRGETARAGATLRGVLQLAPHDPAAHWYLALLDRQRGRYASSEDHLRAFLSSAGDRYPDWRLSAERRLAAVRDERRLAEPDANRAALEFVELDTPNFRIQVDRELDAVHGHYAVTTMEYLEEARSEVASDIGLVPGEPLGVVFYGKAAYQRAHAHRFSFQTVGFFDGRIHVSSPAHPSGSLRSLLFHEYAHAVFREQTGGDRPYWLNEGMAERIERASRGQSATIRSERASLRTRVEAGSWIPLRTLAPSFSGLTDDDARAAYLESVMAVEWIYTRTTTEERAKLLRRIGQGYSIDQALYEVVGMDSTQLDAVLRDEILAEFPSLEP